jgi:hypothetical protein
MKPPFPRCTIRLKLGRSPDQIETHAYTGVFGAAERPIESLAFEMGRALAGLAAGDADGFRDVQAVTQFFYAGFTFAVPRTVEEEP